MKPGYTESQPTQPKVGLKWFLIAVLLFGTTALFWKASYASFLQWDDDINIYSNPGIHGFSLENLQWMLTDVERVRRYMPLAWLSWGLNYTWGGFNPFGYHLGNVLLHAGSTVLLFMAIRKMLGLAARNGARAQSDSRVLWSAAMGASMWGIHPLRVEPVAWASGRIYCQAIFFLLLSLLTYLRFAEARAQNKEDPAFHWLSVAAFAASMLTYPLALGFVIVLFVLDFYPLRRWHVDQAQWWNATNRRVLVEKIPFLVVAALILTVTVFARIHARGLWEPAPSLKEFGVPSRIMQACYIWSYYVWKTLAPIDLAPVYNTLVQFNPLGARFVLSAIALVVVTALVIAKRQQWPGAVALWGSHLILLAPVIGWTEHPHYPSDRYSYLAGLLWSFAVAGALMKIWPSQIKRTAALTAVALLTVLFAGLTFRQIQVWRNSETLFRHTLATMGEVPVSGPIHWRLGLTLAEQGRTEEAVKEFAAAVKFVPNFPQAHANLASALATQGRVPEAVGEYREALRLKPDWPEVLNNFAWLLATHPDNQLRNGAEAVRLAERACELTRGQQAAFIGTLAAAYAEAGRFAEAVAAGERAVGLAAAAGQNELAATNKKFVEMYRANKPVRQPIATEDSRRKEP